MHTLKRHAARGVGRDKTFPSLDQTLGLGRALFGLACSTRRYGTRLAVIRGLLFELRGMSLVLTLQCAARLVRQRLRPRLCIRGLLFELRGMSLVLTLQCAARLVRQRLRPRLCACVGIFNLMHRACLGVFNPTKRTCLCTCRCTCLGLFNPTKRTCLCTCLGLFDPTKGTCLCTGLGLFNPTIGLSNLPRRSRVLESDLTGPFD